MNARTIALLAGLLTSAAIAQESKPAEKAPEKPASPAQPEQPKADKPTSPKPPSLDDLLGLPSDKKPDGKQDRPKTDKPAAQDPNQAALDRMLTQQEMAEQFVQAAKLMSQTADRLEQSRDTSIQTQRIQDDIIRKLDQIIADAKKQQKQSRSKSSSSSSQSQDQQQQDQPQQGSQAQNQNEQRTNTPAQQAGMAPTGNEAQLNPEVARGAQWGNLPARYRDALLQGNADTFSLMYKKWTEAYYKRLAEEAGK